MTDDEKQQIITALKTAQHRIDEVLLLLDPPEPEMTTDSGSNGPAPTHG